MITLRFQALKSYTMYSCARYSVSRELCNPKDPDDAIEELPSCSVVRMFRSLGDDNPYFEHVGETQPYFTCYVMNESGNTIDTIR